MRFRVEDVAEALKAAAAKRIAIEQRVLAEARLDNGGDSLPSTRFLSATAAISPHATD